MNPQFSSIGMIESTSITRGITAADIMLKAAQVTPIFFFIFCPGKYVVAISGDVAAVQASVAAAKEDLGESFVDSFVIANVHADVAVALCGGSPMGGKASLGILETFSASSIVLAADAAAKAASVVLVDVRIAMGLGGKGYALIEGDMASVRAAVAAGADAIAETGLLAAHTVIPQPASGLWDILV